MHSVATTAVLPSADAVIMVSDASSEFTAPELAFLQSALATCPTVLCVLSKTDLFPKWRRILDLDREHLRRAGIDRLEAVLPVHSHFDHVMDSAVVAARTGIEEAVRAAGGELGCGRRLRGLGQSSRALVQPAPHVVGRVRAALPLVAREHGAAGRDTGDAGQSEKLPEAHGP